MTDDPYAGLTQLGRPSAVPASPDEAVLERVANPAPDRQYLVRFTCPEFTCLCPLTGQPDFAHIVIDYMPRDWIVESKSLKLFLASFRNHGAFHEACTMQIAQRLIDVAGAGLAAHRRLLVSARRHADRRVLAERYAARGRVDSAAGRGGLSGAGVTEKLARAAGADDAPLRARAIGPHAGILPRAAAIGPPCDPTASVCVAARAGCVHPRQGARPRLRRGRLLPRRTRPRGARAAGAHSSPPASTATWDGSRRTPTSARQPRALWPEARSVIALGLSYAPDGRSARHAATTRSRQRSRSMRAIATTTTW